MLTLFMLIILSGAVSSDSTEHGILSVIDNENSELRWPVDIRFFLSSEVGNSLAESAAEIVPRVNVAEDPNNMYVEGWPISSRLINSLAKDVANYIKYSSNPKLKALLLPITDGVANLEKPIDDAIMYRNKIIEKMKTQRIDLGVQNMLEKFNLNKERFTIEIDQPHQDVEVIIDNLKELFPSDRVEKLLSYPIVRDELVLKLENAEKGMDRSIAIWGIMQPFFREVVTSIDSEIVGTYDAKSVENRIFEGMLNQLKVLFHNGLLKAKKFNDYLVGDMKGADSITNDIIQGYSMAIRNAFSLCFSRYNYDLYTDSILLRQDFSREREVKLRKCVYNFGLYKLDRPLLLGRVEKLFAKALNASLGIDDSLMSMFPDITAVHEIKLNITRDGKKLFDQELKQYIDRHRSFSKENLTAMASSLKHMTNSYSQNIYRDELTYLIAIEPFTDNVIQEFRRNEEAMDELLKPEIIEKLRHLQEDIEKMATESFGFLKGMFLYSKPYHQIILKFLQSSSTPSGNRDEL